MLQKFREQIKGWIAAVIIGLLIIPFALWGVNSYVNVRPDSAVATVNGEEITPAEYRERHQQQLDRLQQMFGEQFQASLFDNDKMREEILEVLVREELVRQRAKQAGLRVGDEQLEKEIRRLDFFQVDGQFAPDVYRALLAQRGMTTAGFEALLRRQLTDAQLGDAVQRTEFATPAEVARQVALREQKRSLRWTTVPAERFVAQVEITAADVQKWYEDHAAAYMNPETLALEYLELDATKLPPAAAPTEEALRDFYAEQQDSFQSAEQRLARHILIPIDGDEAKAAAAAEALLARLRKGEDFAAIAKAQSQDPSSANEGGSLGWIERGQLVGPFEDALFAMQPGELVGPVKTEFGLHLIRLDEIKAEQAKPFEAVRAELETQLAQRQSEERFTKLAEQLADLAYANPDTLEPAAQALGVAIGRQPEVTRAAGGGVAADEKVRDAAFAPEVLDEGRNSAPIELAPDRLVVVRVAERTPAAQKPLAEVRARVEDALRDARAAEQAEVFARSALERVKAGEQFDAVARALKLAPPQTAEIGRTGGSQAPQAVVAAAFTAAKPGAGGPTWGIAVLEDGGRALFAVDAVTPGNPDGLSDADRKARAAELARRYGTWTLTAYVTELREHSDVKLYPERLR